jgi:hypothetical protein
MINLEWTVRRPTVHTPALIFFQEIRPDFPSGQFAALILDA